MCHIMPAKSRPSLFTGTGYLLCSGTVQPLPAPLPLQTPVSGERENEREREKPASATFMYHVGSPYTIKDHQREAAAAGLGERAAKLIMRPGIIRPRTREQGTDTPQRTNENSDNMWPNQTARIPLGKRYHGGKLLAGRRLRKKSGWKESDMEYILIIFVSQGTHGGADAGDSNEKPEGP